MLESAISAVILPEIGSYSTFSLSDSTRAAVPILAAGVRVTLLKSTLPWDRIRPVEAVLLGKRLFRRRLPLAALRVGGFFSDSDLVGQLHRLCPLSARTNRFTVVVLASVRVIASSSPEISTSTPGVSVQTVRASETPRMLVCTVKSPCTAGIQGAGGGILGQFRGSARRGDGQSLGHGDAVASEAHAEAGPWYRAFPGRSLGRHSG